MYRSIASDVRDRYMAATHTRSRVRNNWRACKVGCGGRTPLPADVAVAAATVAADAAAAESPAIRSRASRVQPPSRQSIVSLISRMAVRSRCFPACYFYSFFVVDDFSLRVFS